MTRSRPVLIYDGDCAFCTSSVDFINRHVRVTAEFTPWQSADLATMGVPRRQAENEVIWVDGGGRIHGGAPAVAALLIDAGGWWMVLGRLMGLPPLRWLARLTYRMIARNRHRLPGATAACALPPEQRPGAQRRMADEA